MMRIQICKHLSKSELEARISWACLRKGGGPGQQVPASHWGPGGWQESGPREARGHSRAVF